MGDETSGDGRGRASLWREAILAIRFGVVGVLATLVHLIVVTALLSFTAVAPLLANTLAFLAAFGISFAGNYLWTFDSPGDPARAMGKFLLVSGMAFALNTAVLVSLIGAGWFSPVVSALLSAAIIPIITFLSSRFWVFKARIGAAVHRNRRT